MFIDFSEIFIRLCLSIWKEFLYFCPVFSLVFKTVLHFIFISLVLPTFLVFSHPIIFLFTSPKFLNPFPFLVWSSSVLSVLNDVHTRCFVQRCFFRSAILHWPYHQDNNLHRPTSAYWGAVLTPAQALHRVGGERCTTAQPQRRWTGPRFRPSKPTVKRL